MAKEIRQWVLNFKKFLEEKGMDSTMPEFVLAYLDNINSGFVSKIKEQRQKIDVLEEEKRKLLKDLSVYSSDRANAIILLKEKEIEFERIRVNMVGRIVNLTNKIEGTLENDPENITLHLKED